MRRTISARSRSAQLAGSIGQGELVVDPAAERAAAPVGQEELAGRRQVELLERLGGLLVEELLEVVVAELELVAVGAGVFLEVSVLEVELEAGVGPVRQGLPGPFRGIGVGGEVLVHRLANRLAELALGLGLGDLLGVLEAGALEVAGGELDAQALADPFGEAGRAVVVGQEPLGGVLDLAVDHLEDHFLGRATLRAGPGGTSRRACAARP